MDPILSLPLTQIDADALPRDRSALEPEALNELATSIATSGLRQPIEVWAYPDPSGPHRYGLISGLRRLTAHQQLAERRGNGDFTTIPAFIRTPASIPAAMAAMVAENEVRADITPWEKGKTLIVATQSGIFDTVEAACATLHPTATRQKRARLRAFAEVVEELDGSIATPEALTTRQMHHLSAALRRGLGELIALTLADHRRAGFASQWQALLPILNEPVEPETANTPGRPRRVLHLKQGLVIRRERSRDGWILRFSGPENKKGGLVDDVIDHIERMFQPS